MAYYSQLKQSVKNMIKQNGQQEITGDVLQSVLISMITNLGTHAQFSGIASLDGNPGTPDGNEFYLAVKPGTYTNFNGITVTESDGLSILINMDGTWTKTATGTAMKADITSLQTSVTNINTKILPLSVSFDLDKIDALTDSSGSTDIKEAFTPLSGFGVAPVAGNILRSGNVIKNSQEVTVIWSDYDTKTAYYSFSYVIDNVLKIFQTDAKTFVRVAKTIVGGDVGAEIEDLQDRVSIGKAPIWITMTLEGEPHDPTRDNIGDIIFFEEGNYLKEVVRSATGGKTLGPAVDMETGRLYVYGGNLCKWDGTKFVPFYLDDINTLKSKARYEYSLQKIFALSSSSGTEDIEEALTPTYAPDGNTAMRLPQSGDLLEATNGATSVVLKGTSSAFSFFYGNNRRDITLSGSAGNYKVAVVVTPLGVRVFDLDKLNALTDESTPENIEEAFRGNYPTAGDLLEGADESSWVIMSGSETSTLARTFTYHTSGKLRTLTVSGDQGNETIKVEETDLAETEYEPKKYGYDKVMALTTESFASEIEMAFTPIGGGSVEFPLPGDLLVSTDGRNHSMFLSCTQTTKSNAPVYLQILNMTNAGAVIHVIGIRGGTAVTSVYDIELDKEVETNGALRITTSNINNITTGGSGSYDLGVTFQQLQDAISNNQLIMGNINGELYAATDGGSSVTLLSVAYLSNNWYRLVMTIPSYTGTTATVTVTAKLLTTFVFVPYSFLSGEIGGTYDNVKMSDLLRANIIQTDKGVATLDTTSGYVLSLLVDGKDYVRCTIGFSDNGGLKLTARTTTPIVPKLEIDFSSAFDSDDNFIPNTEIEGLDKLKEFSETYGPGNVIIRGLASFQEGALFVQFYSDVIFSVFVLKSIVNSNNVDENSVIRSAHATVYTFTLAENGSKTLKSCSKLFYPIISDNVGNTKIYTDDISPIVKEIAGVYNSNTEITSASGFSEDPQSTLYLVYSEGTYQLYTKLATVAFPVASPNKNALYKITRTGTVTDYPEGTVMYEYEGNVLVPAPKTSYNKIAHLVFDLEVIGENDVTLTLDRLNSYWLESIGSSANLNLRYEGGGAHSMPKLDIIYSKINTDVNNDEALWQKAFTDNNIVFTNCDIPSGQKIITTVDLSAGKIATLTIDFSNVTAMSPFKEENSKIFVEIYEPVK